MAEAGGESSAGKGFWQVPLATTCRPSAPPVPLMQACTLTMHSLLYVLPSDAQTGDQIREHLIVSTHDLMMSPMTMPPRGGTADPAKRFLKVFLFDCLFENALCWALSSLHEKNETVIPIQLN